MQPSDRARPVVGGEAPDARRSGRSSRWPRFGRAPGGRRFGRAPGGPRFRRAEGGLGAAGGPALLAAATVWLGFRGGGFDPRTQGIAAVAFAAATIVVVAFTPSSVERLRGALLLALVAIWAFAGWTLVSGAWSGAQGRAVLEYDRACLYATALVLFALLARGPRAVRNLLAATLAASLVLCLAALATRLAPDVFAVGVDQRGAGRLQYPVGYASTLGLLAAYGTLLSFAFAADGDRRPVARILSAGCTPVFATTLLLTYSRGPLATTAVALVVLLVAGRFSATPAALAATVGPTAAATVVAYRSGRLATGDFTSPSALSQGHRLLVALAVCALLAAILRAATRGLDRRRERAHAARRSGPHRPAAARVVAAGVLAAGLALATAIELPALRSAYARFSQPGSNDASVRGRLTDAQGNDRLQAWRVAVADFTSAPVGGRGAGTFVLSWDRSRPYRSTFNETHSLYLQMLGELGLVGLGLLLLALAAILVGLARRARGPHRGTYVGALAAAVAWAVAVAVDWHWQMPVVTLWLFAVGGAALARPATRARRPRQEAARWLGVIVLAGAALLPARAAVAEGHLAHALTAFRARDFPAAAAAAGAADSALGVLPAPLMLLGYCAALSGQPALAVRDVEQAIMRDPDDWTFHYALATVRAAEGLDPRPEARAALRLNPRESLVDYMVATLTGNDPRAWRRQVAAVPIVLPSVFD